MIRYTPFLLSLTAILACGDGPDGTDDVPTDVADLRCPVRFSYAPDPQATTDEILLAGTFNDWDPDANPLEPDEDGRWSTTIELPPGAWAYRFVERTNWGFDGYEGWVCDPEQPLVHCEDGYIEPWQTDWPHECGPGTTSSCNSMVRVADCRAPTLEVTSLAIERGAGVVDVAVSAAAGSAGARLASGEATLDGDPIAGAWTGDGFTVHVSGLVPGRHALDFTVTDAAGRAGDPVHVPFWTDVATSEEGWRRGPVYYAFLDRMRDGDPTNSVPEGATSTLGDFMGGDLQGLIDLLPYLDDLGVGTLWLSNLQDNAEDAWGGNCGRTYAGYHAYWPDQPRAVEEHFGDAATVHALVEAAHARGIRVIMDWVANHVHEDHPYVADHPEWFNDLALCVDSQGGQQNWNRIPESCWFAPYLPDVDYANPEALDVMVDDAIWWLETFDLDGLRVDAAKHMPHSVQANLEARIRAELEHRDAGGDEDLWTIGETFDGVDRIRAYLGEDQLDGQFDFPLYYAITSSFGTQSTDLGAVIGATQTSRDAYGDALMGSFLGNHDVVRFMTQALEGEQGSCRDGVVEVNATTWDNAEAHHRLSLAWTYLMTWPSVPLVYYGDELAMPGFTDPDNRQPMAWYAPSVASDTPPTSVEAMAAGVTSLQAEVVRHVGALSRARQSHPAFWRGETVDWWREPYDAPVVWAWSRVDPVTGDAMIAAVNRSAAPRTLTNGLAFAGLPTDRSWEDVLTGEVFDGPGVVSVPISAWGSRVLVAR